MKKWMVVYKTDDNETCAAFYDEYASARNACVDMECGLGWYWELYMRVAVDEDGNMVTGEDGYPLSEGSMTEYRLMEA